MRTITKTVVEYDGTEHVTLARATHHLEVIYGNLLSSLAHKALQESKYSGMMSFLNMPETRESLRSLLRAKDELDTGLVREDED